MIHYRRAARKVAGAARISFSYPGRHFQKGKGGAISQKWQHFYRSFTEESVLRIASKGAPFFDA